MPQIFHPSFNTIARVSIFGAIFLATAAASLLLLIFQTPYSTKVGEVLTQPVPFSHKHHVGDIGLDCRYCHTGVEDSSFAGIPPTKTCMNCHSQLFSDSPMLHLVRDSFRTGEPLHWNRVHDLPDYVFFNHSIHISKGIACVQCHGRVNEMPLMRREHTLHMAWCLECHRNPEQHVGRRDEVYNVHAKLSLEQDEAKRLVDEYHVQSKTSCYTCHR